MSVVEAVRTSKRKQATPRGPSKKPHDAPNAALGPPEGLLAERRTSQFTELPPRGSGGGRAAIFSPAIVEQARKLAQLGATHVEMAEFFGVSRSTINGWTATHKEFADAVKVGRAHADERVVRSLFGRAVGYSYDAQKVFMYKGAPVVADYVEHMPPDTAACIFWLKNRQPEKWRDTQRHEHALEPFKDLSDEELIRRVQQLQAQTQPLTIEYEEDIDRGIPESDRDQVPVDNPDDQDDEEHIPENEG